MSWFSHIASFFAPNATKSDEIAQQTASLEEFVKINSSGVPASSHSHGTGQKEVSLSPFAQRILEKAKHDAKMREEDEDADPSSFHSPAELFLSKGEAKERVEHIENLTLEKSKHANEKFTQAGRKMPDSRFKFPSFLNKKAGEK